MLSGGCEVSGEGQVAAIEKYVGAAVYWLDLGGVIKIRGNFGSGAYVLELPRCGT